MTYLNRPRTPQTRSKAERAVEGELTRLAERLKAANVQLLEMASAERYEHDSDELALRRFDRLRGKSEGVRLALSYVDEQLRVLNSEGLSDD